MLFSWVLLCLPVNTGALGCSPREKMQLMQLMLLMQQFPTALVASTTHKKNRSKTEKPTKPQSQHRKKRYTNKKTQQKTCPL
jgi:hypothetical protein